MSAIEEIYQRLLAGYGHQGWWPLLDCKGTNPTKTGSVRGYHPGDYSYPQTERQRFEICVGAILTQNAAWPNAEKALLNLKSNGMLSPHAMQRAGDDTIKEYVRPAGYFNQKAKKLRIFAAFYLSLRGVVPARDGLLKVWGIGPETADSILLYAYGIPEFVVDAYTRRILISKNIIREQATYGEIKALLERELRKDYCIYQECHALLVEHAKRCYARSQYGEDALLKGLSSGEECTKKPRCHRYI